MFLVDGGGNVLKHRVLSAIVLIPVVVAAVYCGGLWFFALVTVAALLATHEFLTIVRRKDYGSSYLLGLSLTALLMASGIYPHAQIASFALAGVSMLTLVWELLRGNAPGSLENWALTVAGPV